MSKSYKCGVCGMILVNARELTKHEIRVHVDKMYQCQSCNKIFKSNIEFSKHIETHRVLFSKSPNLFQTVVPNCLSRGHDVDIDPTSLKQEAKEKRAKRRTRGPHSRSQQVNKPRHE